MNMTQYTFLEGGDTILSYIWQKKIRFTHSILCIQIWRSVPLTILLVLLSSVSSGLLEIFFYTFLFLILPFWNFLKHFLLLSILLSQFKLTSNLIIDDICPWYVSYNYVASKNITGKKTYLKLIKSSNSKCSVFSKAMLLIWACIPPGLLVLG